MRGSEINSVLQHAVEIFCEPLPVALQGVGEVVYRSAREISAKHRAAPIEPD